MKKDNKNTDSKKLADTVKTPPPPQIIDPSSPPGKGKNSEYKKDKRHKG